MVYCARAVTIVFLLMQNTIWRHHSNEDCPGITMTTPKRYMNDMPTTLSSKKKSKWSLS